MTEELRRGALICVAVEGRLLEAESGPELRQRAVAAAADGADAVLVSHDVLGDPIVLAGGLVDTVPETWVGVRLGLAQDGRHPAMLARDMTSLDLVSGGRSILCFLPPFTDELAEAIGLCRALWRGGAVQSDGPRFPAQAPGARARPASDASPLIGLDLTTGAVVPASFGELADLLVRPTPDPGICDMERV